MRSSSGTTERRAGLSRRAAAPAGGPDSTCQEVGALPRTGQRGCGGSSTSGLLWRGGDRDSAPRHLGDRPASLLGAGGPAGAAPAAVAHPWAPALLLPDHRSAMGIAHRALGRHRRGERLGWAPQPGQAPHLHRAGRADLRRRRGDHFAGSGACARDSTCRSGWWSCWPSWRPRSCSSGGPMRTVRSRAARGIRISRMTVVRDASGKERYDCPLTQRRFGPRSTRIWPNSPKIRSWI
jgi:hypothetical protein